MPGTVTVKAVKEINNQIVEWIDEEVTIPEGGLPVNLFTGQTGHAKTSTIQMLAGGKQTAPGGASDTKDNCIYKVVIDGVEYLLLDTVGLVDTASTPEQREAFLARLIAFIKEKELNIVKSFVCVKLGSKNDQNVAEWMSILFQALGNLQSVGLITSWLITAWNLDSPREERACADDMKNANGTYNTCKNNGMGFGVVTFGYENLAELTNLLCHAASSQKGLPRSSMDGEIQHHANMVRAYNLLEETLTKQKAALKSLTTDEEFKKQEQALLATIDQASADLANCGKSESKKEEYRKMITQATEAIKKTHTSKTNTAEERQQKAAELTQLNDQFQKQLKRLAEREGIMDHLASLAGIIDPVKIFNFIHHKKGK